MHELLNHVLILLRRDLALFTLSVEAPLLVLPLDIRIDGSAFGPHRSSCCWLFRSILPLGLRIGSRVQSFGDARRQPFVLRTLLSRRGMADRRGCLLRLLTFHQATVDHLLSSLLRHLVDLALCPSLRLHARASTRGWLLGGGGGSARSRLHDVLNGCRLLNFDLNFSILLLVE